MSELGDLPRRSDGDSSALRERLTECVEALDVAWGDIHDWVKTARGLRERSQHPKGPDYDNVPHERGIRESERVLAHIGAVSTAAQKVLDDAV